MRKLRVGIVGCGIISDWHVDAYLALADRAEIVACCDVNPASAARLAARAGGVRVTTEFERLLAMEEVEAIEILTPHHLHREQAIAALDEGRHVLLQKPLAHSLEDSEAIVEAARNAWPTLYYGEIRHTDPSVLRARQAIEDGEIGDVVAINAIYANWQGGDYLDTAWRYDPKLAGGGALLDGGIHLLAAMVVLCGRVQAVSSRVRSVRPELGGEDTAVLCLEFANGSLGSLTSTHASGVWPPYPSISVIGMRGMLTLGGGQGATTVWRRDLPDGKSVLLQDRGDLFVSMIEHYLDVVQNGIPCQSSPELGLHELRAVLAAYESAKTGRTVEVS